jgi:hypothetical protein
LVLKQKHREHLSQVIVDAKKLGFHIRDQLSIQDSFRTDMPTLPDLNMIKHEEWRLLGCYAEWLL